MFMHFLMALAGLQESLAPSSFAQRLLCCPSDGSRLCPRDRDCHSDPGPSSLQLHVKVDLSCRATLVCLAQSQPGEGSHCYQELETELPRLTKPVTSSTAAFDDKKLLEAEEKEEEEEKETLD